MRLVSGLPMRPARFAELQGQCRGGDESDLERPQCYVALVAEGVELPHEAVERLQPDEAVEEVDRAIGRALRDVAALKLEQVREGGERKRQGASAARGAPLEHL